MRKEPVEHPHWLEYQATLLLCIGSVVLSVLALQREGLEFLYLTYESWPHEPWRLLTSCLIHGSWLHLAFNIYWTYRFGVTLEPILGLVPFVAVIVLLGATSSAAQWAFSGGGVGLSGVGYGLFGVLWALNRYHPRFRGVLSDEITLLFVAWFFLCIVATHFKVMNIANIAHGSGALVGALIGLGLSSVKKRRWLGWTSVALVTASIGLASTVGRPYVNYSDQRVWELNVEAIHALEAKDWNRAVELLEAAIDRDDEDITAWHNLGVAYQRLLKFADARRALDRAKELEREQKERAASEDMNLPSMPRLER